MTKYLFCCEICFVVYRSRPELAHRQLDVDGVVSEKCDGKFKRIQDFLSMEEDFKSAESKWTEIVAVRKALILERNEIRRSRGWYDKPRIQQIEQYLANTVAPLRDAAREREIARARLGAASNLRAEIRKNREAFKAKIKTIKEFNKREDAIRHDFLNGFSGNPETRRRELDPYEHHLSAQIQIGLFAICAWCSAQQLVEGEFSEIRLRTHQSTDIDVVTGSRECAFSNRILTNNDRYELLAGYVRNQWSTSSSNSVSKITRRRPSPQPNKNSKPISQVELDVLNLEAKRLETRKDQFGI
jgi:hypothetical protein